MIANHHRHRYYHGHHHYHKHFTFTYLYICLPNNTKVQTRTAMQLKRAGQQGPIQTLTAALEMLTSMFDLLAVGPKFTRPSCRAAAAATDWYLLQASVRPQQQTRPHAAAAVDRRDRQTDGHATVYRILCGPRNKTVIQLNMWNSRKVKLAHTRLLDYGSVADPGSWQSACMWRES